jgi:hypothetical protein
LAPKYVLQGGLFAVDNLGVLSSIRPCQNNLAMLVGACPSVHELEFGVTCGEELEDFRSILKCSSDVIDLPPFILPVWIGEEQDLLDGRYLWGDIAKRSAQISPYRMKFSFNHHPRPFPNLPTVARRSSVVANLLGYGRVAVIHISVPGRFDGKVQRFTVGHH